MRRRMEAGLRHAQPAQALAALQDLSTGRVPVRTDHEIANLIDQRRLPIQKSSFRDSLFREAVFASTLQSATAF